MTGTAACHWSPSTTGTKSGAMTASPASAGTEMPARIRVTRAQAAAIRSGWSWMRQKAGDMTRWIGPPILVAGWMTVLNATAYAPSAAVPRKRPTRKRSPLVWR